MCVCVCVCVCVCERERERERERAGGREGEREREITEIDRQTDRYAHTRKARVSFVVTSSSGLGTALISWFFSNSFKPIL